MGLWDRVYLTPKVSEGLNLHQALHPIEITPEEFTDGQYEPTMGERRNPDMKSYYIKGKMEAPGIARGSFPFHKTLAAPNVGAVDGMLDLWIKEHNKNSEQKWGKILSRTISTEGPPPKKEQPILPIRNTHPEKKKDAEEVKSKSCIGPGSCGRTLPIDKFWLNNRAPDGHMRLCKDCMAKVRRNRKMREDPATLLAQPRGPIPEGTELLPPPRRVKVDDEVFVHLGDLINLLRRPR